MSLFEREEIDIRHWCVRLKTAALFSDELRSFMNEQEKIDLGDPRALAAYNKAVAKIIADLEITVPENHLIPTICLRQAYLAVLVDEFLPSGGRILEVGTGASAILSLLAAKLYGLDVVATEIDEQSIASAKKNIEQNNLQSKITLLESQGQILDGLIEDHGHFDMLITYPPTYPEKDSDTYAHGPPDKGFKGTISEMIGGGNEGYEFISQLINQAVSQDISHISLLLIFPQHVQKAMEQMQGLGLNVRRLDLLAGTRRRFIVVGSTVDYS